MLTIKQRELLLFIHQRIKETGTSPSFDEMRDALDLASKSGIHRLILALEERGFLRRLPHRARALEVIKMPDSATPAAPPRGRSAFRPSVVGASIGNPVFGGPILGNHSSRDEAGKRRGIDPRTGASNARDIPVLGRIAAGTPISAIQNEISRFQGDEEYFGDGELFGLEIHGDSMIEAGILSGDLAVLRRCDTAETGDIIVALIDGEEATLKRLRRRGNSIALEAANPAFETRIFGPDRVQIQGKLVGLVRRYST